MQVVDYELYEVPPRWQILRVETSDGTIGWGEHTLQASDMRAGQSSAGAVRDFMDEFVVGTDPLEIERRWQEMFRRHYRGGPVFMTAISAIDMALWDIKGKHYDLPVYELFGGKARDRIRLYQHVVGETPSDMADWARKQVEEERFTALKLSFHENYRSVDTQLKVEQTEAAVAAIREAVGDGVDFGVDFHGRASKPMAKRIIEALEPHDPMWIEEPVLPEFIDEMADIAAFTKLPIATGERMWNRWDFKEAFEKNALQVAQPDVAHAGGITELKKIGAMAEAYDNALAPHMPYGPVALAASLQVDGCTPNAFIQEQLIHRMDPGIVEDLVVNNELFEMDDEGFVEIPGGPGLGIELNEEHLETAEADWDPEYWYYDDGSVADK